MKRPAKHSSINIYEYPKELYSAYWEYVVNQDLTYQVMLYDYSGKILESFGGGPFDSEDEARAEAQASIQMKMAQYRVNADPLSDEAVNELVRQFDKARREAVAGDVSKFGEVDRIRGLLKAHGIALDEEESIGYEHDTTWVRS